MKEKEVVLIRKQSTPFTVNFPIDGRIKKYKWLGTKGKVLDKKAVPFEVYNWLAMYTTTLEEGCLIVEDTYDEEVIEIKENIDNIENIEKAVLTKEEIETILTTGNHLVLKKELDNLIQGLSPEMIQNQKRYVVNIASELGIDSSAKRKVIAEWAGLNYENSDLIFDKELKEMYKENNKDE